MTELSLYTFLESIANVIPTVQNRFLVVEGGAGDLNADNSDDAIIGNSVNQTTWQKKYPCAVLMPPLEVGRNRQKNTTRYQLTMYFLTTTYADGMNATKSINVQTNTSKVSIKEDWSQMKSAAEDFMATMRNTFYTDLTVLDYIRPVKSNEELYQRVSLANNDRLSGIRLIFELDVVIGCGAYTGNAPTWPTPEPSCGVCSPGEADQVWATSVDGNSVGWRTVAFGGAGLIRVIATVSENTTAANGSNTFYIYRVSGATTITIPTSIGNTNWYRIKRIGDANVTIIFTGGETADSESTIVLTRKYQSIDLVPNNINYDLA